MQREWSSSFNSRDGPSDHAPLGKERFTTNTYVPPSTSGEAAYCPPVPDPSQHLLLPQYFNPAAFAAAATAVGVSGVKVENSYMDASRTTTSSRASISISNASDLDLTEWVENDEPGVGDKVLCGSVMERRLWHGVINASLGIIKILQLAPPPTLRNPQQRLHLVLSPRAHPIVVIN
ncbi:hypothetical protein BHM03_00052518 [Ensete ventricosum]|nr:hypothetical protein BHM03_00052518 [Ensete ventricosum]